MKLKIFNVDNTLIKGKTDSQTQGNHDESQAEVGIYTLTSEMNSEKIYSFYYWLG